jgi:hypothetical protein
MKRILYIIMITSLATACASQPSGHCDAYGQHEVKRTTSTSNDNVKAVNRFQQS